MAAHELGIGWVSAWVLVWAVQSYDSAILACDNNLHIRSSWLLESRFTMVSARKTSSGTAPFSPFGAKSKRTPRRTRIQRTQRKYGHGSTPQSLSPSEHPNPTTKMGGEFTYPKMEPLVLNHGQMSSLPEAKPASRFSDIQVTGTRLWSWKQRDQPVVSPLGDHVRNQPRKSDTVWKSQQIHACWRNTGGSPTSCKDWRPNTPELFVPPCVIPKR